MRFPRCVGLVSVLTGAALLLGCGDSKSQGMKNMVPGTGPPVQRDMPLKKGKKPMPPDLPPPKPPPR
jgi:hypothetical protein